MPTVVDVFTLTIPSVDEGGLTPSSISILGDYPVTVTAGQSTTVGFTYTLGNPSANAFRVDWTTTGGMSTPSQTISPLSPASGTPHEVLSGMVLVVIPSDLPPNEGDEILYNGSLVIIQPDS